MSTMIKPDHSKPLVTMKVCLPVPYPYPIKLTCVPKIYVYLASKFNSIKSTNDTFKRIVSINSNV